MTVKDEAYNIVNKIYQTATNIGWEDSKSAALVLVDKILELIINVDGVYFTYGTIYGYYKDVKKEIKKL